MDSTVGIPDGPIGQGNPQYYAIGGFTYLANPDHPDEVLAELNKWEARYEVHGAGEGNCAVPGEIMARIHGLKAALLRLGYTPVWDEKAYVLRKTEPKRGTQY